MSVQSVFVVAAVPLPAEVGVEEKKSAFWLNKLFGSGRKRKLSRDIGTSITEEQLYQESPPASPRSPAACARAPGALPDLVTCCQRRPQSPVVFTFPEVGGGGGGGSAGSPPEPSPELRCRLAGLDGTPRGGGGGGGGMVAPAPAPAAAAAHVDDELREVGRCLRRCADEFELSRRDRPSSSPSPSAPSSSSRRGRGRPVTVERLAAGALVAATAVCVCRRLYN
ncbi:gap junction alpha-3 protein-like [Amphibalanus amphitrite]|uniref:gap junction alpha-3 protein-like n=1 Tax=Amphibalanus amphitrite TaxID=1232801 RepID=UPI001C923778|nr:gap junction alpha-3 protein-like [Amphibalanus amphitrite]